MSENVGDGLARFRDLWRRAIEVSKARPEEYWDQKRRERAAAYDAELKARCAEEMSAKPRVDVALRLQQAGFPGEQRERLCGQMDERPAFSVTRRWWSQTKTPYQRADGNTGFRLPHPWLTLLGASGAGKTQAAVWVAAEFARSYDWQGQPGGGALLAPITYLTMGAFCAMPWDDFGERSTLRQERLASLRRTRLLVLDDVGRERLPDPARSALYELLDARHGDNRLTIFTSNLDTFALEERLDGPRASPNEPGRMWRRMNDKGWVVTLGRKKVEELLVGGKHQRPPS